MRTAVAIPPNELVTLPVTEVQHTQAEMDHLGRMGRKNLT